MDTSTADLVALHLAAVETPSDGDGPAPRAAAVPGIGEALSLGTDAMADRIELLSALSTLKERELVTEQTRPVEGLDGERNVYSLTAAGREHAADLRASVRDREITVRDGDRQQTVPLSAVDRYLEAPAVVRALSRLTDDDVLYLDGEEGRRFVDRRRPLGALSAALSAAVAGESRGVLVTGEAGVGKTTLVSELLAAAREEGCRVLEGVCRRDGSEPYHPFRTALADAEETTPAGDVPTPDLAAGAADHGPDLDDADSTTDPFDRAGVDLVATEGDADDLAAQRRALFADVVDRLEALAADAPVVLFVDDLHSADEATLELFEHVASEVEGRVLLVGTFRQEDLPADHPLPSLAEAWERAPPASALPDPHEESVTAARPGATPERFAVELSPFGREVTATLARRLLGAAPPASFVDAVYEHTGGNPLFVTETVARMQETGAVDPTADLYPTDEAALPLPDRVEEAVDVRLQVLDDPARRVLEVGALVGESIPYDVLAAAVDVPEPELRDYVDLLVDSRVWERTVADGGERPRLDVGERGDGRDDTDTPTGLDPGEDTDDGAGRSEREAADNADEQRADDTAGDGEWLRFSSGLVRETVVDRVDPERTRAVHARIAEAMVEVDGDDARASAVAHHYREADRPADALEWYLRAADRAREVYAHGVAVERYERALALAESLDDHDRVLSIREQLGRVHRVLGEIDRANELFDRVRRGTDDDATRVRIARHQSRMESRRGAYEEAITHADRGLAIVDGEDCPARVRLLSHKGGAHLQVGEFEAARELLAEAIDVAEAIDDDAGLGTALHTLATLEMSQHGADDAAVETMRRAVELRERAGDRSGVASSLNNLGAMHLQAGDLAAAREAFEQCLSLNEEMGDVYGVLKVRNNLGKVHESRDEYDRALECYERVLEEARRLGARQSLANALANAAGIYHEHRYDLDTAERYLERSLAIQRDLDNTRWKINANLDLANVRASAGDLEAGLSHAERALSLAREAEMPARRCTAERYVGDIRNERGDHERALEHHERALDLALEFEDLPDKEVLTCASFVDTYLHLDRVEDAREQAERAREAASRAVEAYDERYPKRLAVYADVATAKVHRAAGDLDRTADLLEDALDRADSFGMHQHAATTRYERARLAIARGDHDAARERLHETRETAADLAFGLLVEKCERRLAELDAGDG